LERVFVSKSLTLQNAGSEIRNAVNTLVRAKQFERDLTREGFHRALFIALHAGCMWEKATWR
jgi:hypothetical protein